MTLDLALQAAVSGLLMGGIYALVALALALVFGVMRVLNFAHGDLLLVAMYGTVVLNQALGLHPYASTLLLVPLMGVLGWGLFAALIRPLLGSSALMQAQLTIGVSFMIQSAALMIFGADLMNVRTSFESSTLPLGRGIVVGVPLLVAFAVSVLACAAVAWFLARTETGVRIRATAQDPVMARLCGVAVPRLQKMVFAASIALLALAAGSLMTFFHVTPTTGVQFSILSLLIVVLGGLGDLKGAFVGGLMIGLAESLAGAAFDSALAPAVIYILFALTLLFRPRGLFGRGSIA
ncbi:MAG: branched-chain amino acid ABC transporter permease [Rubrivivax sp.]|nr:branched-chain amino acid ABC transporter permease [Burkholderiales bacterium]MCW5634503.1 branched-chain amino acid ABC transporter permease [Rubrivivax sp.]